MDFTIVMFILLAGFITLILFKIFDFFEIKKNKYRKRRFFIFYHFVAMFFSGITFATAMILGIFSLLDKNFICFVFYVLIESFTFINFASYVERFAFCIPKKDSL